MKYLNWTETHACIKDTTGFFTCIDCNKVYPRMNARQQRCEGCQENYRHATESSRKKNRYQKLKEEKVQRISSLASRLKKT